MSHCPVRREAADDTGEPLLFAHPAEVFVPGPWTAPPQTPAALGPLLAESASRSTSVPGTARPASEPMGVSEVEREWGSPRTESGGARRERGLLSMCGCHREEHRAGTPPTPAGRRGRSTVDMACGRRPPLDTDSAPVGDPPGRSLGENRASMSAVGTPSPSRKASS
jgi:hypothetical protein